MNYESVLRVDSKFCPGVVYTVARLSFGRRLELMRDVRELATKLEFHRAGQTEADHMDASLLSAEIDRLYVRWGLREIEGLAIDEERATPDSLAAAGPEELFIEALLAVKEQCGLTDPERKN
jgi:hypothetical protein